MTQRKPEKHEKYPIPRTTGRLGKIARDIGAERFNVRNGLEQDPNASRIAQALGGLARRRAVRRQVNESRREAVAEARQAHERIGRFTDVKMKAQGINRDAMNVIQGFQYAQAEKAEILRAEEVRIFGNSERPDYHRWRAAFVTSPETPAAKEERLDRTRPMSVAPFRATVSPSSAIDVYSVEVVTRALAEHGPGLPSTEILVNTPQTADSESLDSDPGASARYSIDMTGAVKVDLHMGEEWIPMPLGSKEAQDAALGVLNHLMNSIVETTALYDQFRTPLPRAGE